MSLIFEKFGCESFVFSFFHSIETLFHSCEILTRQILDKFLELWLFTVSDKIKHIRNIFIGKFFFDRTEIFYLLSFLCSFCHLDRRTNLGSRIAKSKFISISRICEVNTLLFVGCEDIFVDCEINLER